MVINYVKLHAEPTEGKTLDISEYKHYWFIPKIPCDNLPVKMKENEMGNQRELKGSTIMHKFIHSIDAAPFQARPALKY